MGEASGEANLRKIRNVSICFTWVCSGLMVIVPILTGGYWTVADAAMLSGRWLGEISPIEGLTPIMRLIGFALTLMAEVPVLLGLNSLRCLFLLYSEGTMFGERNVAALRNLGLALMFFGVAQLLLNPLLSLALTFGNAPGRRVVTVGISSGVVVAAIVGGVLLVIAWVMDEARKTHEEQSLTV